MPPFIMHPAHSTARADWQKTLTTGRVRALVPLDVLVAALEPAASYAAPPEQLASHAVRAQVLWPGERLAHRVVLSQIYDYLYSDCSRCGRYQNLCRHAVGVLADLALSPALRESALGQPVAPETLAELPALRAHWASQLRLERVLSNWIPPVAEAPLRGVSVLLSILPPESEDPFAPGLELRLRYAGEKGLLHPTQALPRLDPALRRALAVTEPPRTSRKALVAFGAASAITLSLLRGQDVTMEGGSGPVRWADSPVRLRITHATIGADELQRSPHTKEKRRTPAAADAPAKVSALVPRWSTEDGRVDVAARDATFFGGGHALLWVPSAGTLFPVDASVDQDLAGGFYLSPALAIPQGMAPAVFRSLRAGLRGRAVPLPAPEQMGLSPVEAPVFELRLDGDPFSVRAELAARYSFATFSLGAPAGPDAVAEQRVLRDETAEEEAVVRLQSFGLAYDATAQAFLTEDEAALRFWTEALPRLREEAPDFAILVPERLARLKLRGALKTGVRLSLEGGWLDASVHFSVDGLQAEMALLQAALRARRGWVMLSDGTLARINEAVRDLVEEASDSLDAAGHARLPTHALGRVEHWAAQADEAEVSPELEALRARLRALSVNEAGELPRGLTATLRPYQAQGLGWLQFLAELGAGGILADDMGLGKTLMALALFLWQKERSGAAPSLVVCPTSVVGNWQREAARFAPGLRVLVFQGLARRERFGELAAADLVVTSYALLRRDVDVLAEVPFRTLVLDEAQNVKNADAETRKSVARIQATQRLALTGTPVENRLGELWSILDVCNPGMLGSARQFEQRFERPILASPHGHAASQLRARIRPFVLRRTKRQVLAELPEKEEIDLVCSPGAEQQKLYDALALMLRSQVSEKIAEEGLARSGLVVLTALLRLRQMCCDPRLVEPSRPAELGAKRAAFLELVRELVAEGRRALVFSQFVSLLTLWRQDLDAEGLAYEYLDGSTKDRDGAVERFQKGDAPLFLISLKAGGAGLNLTAADTVIHCDPWWNPAVEDQATDRAHRMGQQRKVTVYRLVLKGTIEDKIATLKSKKRGLADAVIHDDAGALRGLGAEDVALLLSDVEEDVPLPETEMPLPALPPPPRRVEPAAQTALPAAPPSTPVAPAPSAPPRETPSKERLEGEALEALVDRVQAWFRTTGGTQAELARGVDLSQPELSRIVRGHRRRIPAELAERLTKAIDGSGDT